MFNSPTRRDTLRNPIMAPKMSDREVSTKKDSHYHLSKKVAQLTKVIVQLNTLNEKLTRDNKKCAAAKQRLLESHSQEITSIKEEADGRIQSLQDEVKSKDSAIREVNSQLILAQDEVLLKETALNELNSQLSLVQDEVICKDSAINLLNNQLTSVQCEAKSKVNLLQSDKDDLQLSHTQTVKEITQSLEQQSLQHKENVITLRRELLDEHQKKIQELKVEMNDSHKEEIELLKTRHDRHNVRREEEALEQQENAVTNAVAMARLEHEKLLSQQLISHNQQCEMIKREVEDRLGKEISALEQELEITTLHSNEIEAKLDKLQKEAVRMQSSLDAMSASNQAEIMELKTRNTKLHNDLRTAKEVSREQLKHIKSVEEENDELKVLLDKIDAQKNRVESKLQTLTETKEREQQLSCAQLKQRDITITTLQSELNDVKSTNANLGEQLQAATDDISVLSRYKTAAEQALSSLTADLNQRKTNCRELAHLAVSSVVEFAAWKQQTTEEHSFETAKLENMALVQQGQVNKLQTVVKEYEISSAEAATANANLERKVQYLEETAKNIAIARTGERLSWEKTLDDLNVNHRKELSRVTCLAMDEADILGNQIADLRDTLKKNEERAASKIRLLDLEWNRKVENQDAAMSRLKYESALEIQGLTVQLGEVSDTLVCKESECTTLATNISSMRNQQVIIAQEHELKLEDISRVHQSELETATTIHMEEMQQQRKEFEQVVSEKENECSILMKQIDILRSKVTAERSGRISELSDIKNHLCELQGQVNSIKKEWKSVCSSVISTKLRTMAKRYDDAIVKHNIEMDILRNTHAEAEEILNKKLEATTKEANDAKSMLFNTIRENKTKLERALSNLRQEQEKEIELVQYDGEVQCEAVTAKLQDMSAEYAELAKANAKKVDVIIEKDKAMNVLKDNMADTVKSCEEEIGAIQQQHESEREKLMAEMKSKESELAKNFVQEKADLQSEMQARVEAATKELDEAKKSSLPDDLEHIQWLQNENERLTLAETEGREKMLHFKLELENRETTWNKRFVEKSSPLRVKDDNKSKTTTRRKTGAGGTRGTGSSTRTRKKTTTNRLPKL